MLFAELSLDIKRLVLSFVTRPTDLKSLCLTSKDLHEIATPYLYRCVSLRVGGKEDLRLTQMLHLGNTGLNHVRHLDLRLEKWLKPKSRSGSDDEDSSGSDEVDAADHVEESVSARFAQLTIKMLLDYLPSNILESFTWDTWEPLGADNFCLLCKKQKTLQYMEIGPTDKKLMPSLEKNPGLIEGFSDLKRLDLYPDCLDTLKAGQKFIEAYPNLKALRVVTGFQYNRKVALDEISDSSTQPGILSRLLFSHMMPFGNTQDPLNLKSLVLDEVEVRYAADTWLNIVKFPNLEKLEVRGCAGADVLFAQLSKPHLRPHRLQKLKWMDEHHSEKHALKAFEGFLESISSLENLNVWLSNMDSLPKAESIIRHKHMKILSLHAKSNANEVHVITEGDLTMLCSECEELRQLSIAFPEMEISNVTFPAEFQVFLDVILKKLKTLVTLNIRRWPAPREWFEGRFREAEQNLRHYEHDLQRFSQQIFERSDRDAEEDGFGLGHRSNLSVIAWGPPGRSYRDYSSVDRYQIMQIPFIRATVVDPYGKIALYAMKTNWRLASYIEPESSILQIALTDLYEPEEGLVRRKRR